MCQPVCFLSLSPFLLSLSIYKVYIEYNQWGCFISVNRISWVIYIFKCFNWKKLHYLSLPFLPPDLPRYPLSKPSNISAHSEVYFLIFIIIVTCIHVFIEICLYVCAQIYKHNLLSYLHVCVCVYAQIYKQNILLHVHMCMCVYTNV